MCSCFYVGSRGRAVFDSASAACGRASERASECSRAFAACSILRFYWEVDVSVSGRCGVGLSRVASCCVTSCHLCPCRSSSSGDIVSCPSSLVSYHVTSRHVTSRQVTSGQVRSDQVRSGRVSDHLRSCHVISGQSSLLISCHVALVPLTRVVDSLSQCIRVRSLVLVLLAFLHVSIPASCCLYILIQQSD